MSYLSHFDVSKIECELSEFDERMMKMDMTLYSNRLYFAFQDRFPRIRETMSLDEANKTYNQIIEIGNTSESKAKEIMLKLHTECIHLIEETSIAREVMERSQIQIDTLESEEIKWVRRQAELRRWIGAFRHPESRSARDVQLEHCINCIGAIHSELRAIRPTRQDKDRFKDQSAKMYRMCLVYNASLDVYNEYMIKKDNVLTKAKSDLDRVKLVIDSKSTMKSLGEAGGIQRKAQIANLRRQREHSITSRNTKRTPSRPITHQQQIEQFEKEERRKRWDINH